MMFSQIVIRPCAGHSTTSTPTTARPLVLSLNICSTYTPSPSSTTKRPDAKSFGQVFCSICGSGMPRENAAMQVYNVPLGTLDSDPEYVPDFHIFTESKAPWFEIHDQIPQLPEGPS